MRLFLLCSIIFVLSLASACSQPVDPSRCEGDSCVSADPCNPNPCKGTFRTECSVADGGVSCGCVDGYVLKGAECIATPVTACANAHSGGVGEDPYEPDECSASASPLVPGYEAQWHSIYPAGDRDWYTLSVAKNTLVELEVTGAQAPVTIAVYDSAGQVVIPAGGGSIDPKIVLSSTNTETFSVLLAGGAYDDTGGYTILAHALQPLPYDDFGNSMHDAGVLASLTPPAHFLAEVDYPGDIDWIRFDVTAGRTYDVELYSASNAAARVNVVHADGGLFRTVQSAYPGPYSTRFVADSDERMALAGYSASNILPWFDVIISDLGEDDHGDDRANATALATLGASSGTIDYEGDVDFFTVPVDARHAYRLQCTQSCDLEVLSASGVSLGASIYTPTVEAKADSTELWGIRVKGNGFSPVGPYSWTILDLGPDDHGDTLQTATAITVGTPETGVFEINADPDWFSFTGAANSVYRVSCNYCALSAYRASGIPVGTASGNTADFVAPASETYFIRAWRNAAASYSVTVSLQGSDDHGNSPAFATSVTGLVATGKFDYAGDVDAFRLTAAPGSIWRILTAGSTYLYSVVEADGGFIASANAHPALPAFKVPPSGVYYVLASNGFLNASYEFSVWDAGQDDHGDTPATATLVSPDAGAIVTADYQGDVDFLGFDFLADHIYGIQCSSLSAGSCDPLLSDPSGGAPLSFRDNGRIFLKAVTSGEHHARLSSPSSSAATRSSVVFWDEGLDDHANTIASATLLTVGTPTNVALNYPNDLDAFSFDAVAGHVYSLDISPVSLNVQLTNYDAQGNALAWNMLESGRRFFASSTGRRSFTLGNGYAFQSFALTVTDHGADDYGNTASTASPHAVGGQSTGQFQYSGDVDAFTVQLTSGQHYHFKLTGCFGCSMTVQDPTGASAGWTSWPEHMGVRATSTGAWTVLTTYPLDISANPVSFTLQSTVEPVDDHGDTPATATPADYYVYTSGSLESPLDVDAFAMPLLQQGATYSLIANSSSSLGLQVRDDAGAQVPVTSPSKNAFTFTPGATKRWTLMLFNKDPDVAGGAYTFRVQ